MDGTMLFAGSLFGGLAVVLGAFGAHQLRVRLSPDMLQVWDIAVRYQMYHALALLGVAWATYRWPQSRLAVWAGWFFILGIVLFSGSLYVLALTGHAWLGAVTPVGGLAFIAGWASLVVVAWRA